MMRFPNRQNLAAPFAMPFASPIAVGSLTLHSIRQQFLDGLVGYWAMESGDVSGDQLIDLSGEGNHGTIHGAVVVPGKIAQAMSFDGVDDYVDCGHDSSLSITDMITISAWVRRIGSSSGDEWFLSNNERNYAGGINSNGKLLFETKNQALSSDILISNDVFGDTWTHFAATYSTSDETKRLYINGVLDNSKTISGYGELKQGGFLTLGAYYRGYSNEFNGSIDEVRIYDRALSADEILAYYYSTSRY